MIRLSTLLFAFSLLSPHAHAASSCGKYFALPKWLMKYTTTRPEIESLTVDFPGLQIAQVTDSTGATGATLFLFPKGAKANFDARGGSVASVETTLLEEGSYSNVIDGLVFTGGSTMGLEASSGVRKVLYNQRKQSADWDIVPSIPGAVIYDYSARVEKGQNKHAYPDREMGQALMSNLGNKFLNGRAGAGTSSSANKATENPIFGGQGAVMRKYPWGRIFVAIIPNPVGRIAGIEVAPRTSIEPEPLTPGKNTTLSVVVTDLDLDRSALKRLSITAHTRLAEKIVDYFHSPYDGDINFAVSAGNRKMKPEQISEIELARIAGEMLIEATDKAVRVANGLAPAATDSHP